MLNPSPSPRRVHNGCHCLETIPRGPIQRSLESLQTPRAMSSDVLKCVPRFFHSFHPPQFPIYIEVCVLFSVLLPLLCTRRRRRSLKLPSLAPTCSRAHCRGFGETAFSLCSITLKFHLNGPGLRESAMKNGTFFFIPPPPPSLYFSRGVSAVLSDASL